jgi:hypothetical protein
VNLLDRLPYAVEAPFNAYQRQHEPTCLPYTRVHLLREIYDWADGQDKPCIFWLNGLAGTGKSTVARTLAAKYLEMGRLGASFFFSRGGGDVGHAGKLVTSIAVQLANNIQHLKQNICGAITERSDITSQSLRDQWRHLVLGPLSNLSGNSRGPWYILVIDALDECDNDSNIRIILQFLAEAGSLAKARLRVFLTSRPEFTIRHSFYQMPDAEHQDFVLHNISPSIVDHDIGIFLDYNLKLIGQEHALEAGWPEQEAVRHLIQHTGGLFIWAATACRFIREGLFADERLRIILEGGNSTATPEEHLNHIYMTVLRNSIHMGYIGQDSRRLCEMLRDVLGSIIVLFSPLSLESLSKLLLIPKQRVDRTLKDIHAILDVPKEQAHPLRLHHPSFRDFLLDKDRCTDQDFQVNRKQAHQKLATGCIQLMSKFLKQDICNVGRPGALVADVESSHLERHLPPEIQYACLYWIQHLEKGDFQLFNHDQVHEFLQIHLLHWLEALSWMRRVSEGIHAITSLESIALVSQLLE